MEEDGPNIEWDFECWWTWHNWTFGLRFPAYGHGNYILALEIGPLGFALEYTNYERLVAWAKELRAKAEGTDE